MSIFNKGFAKFVKKQLDTRKTILSNNGSTDSSILGDNSRQKNYLNYQARTPFVRLTSGVDIPEYYKYFSKEIVDTHKAKDNTSATGIGVLLPGYITGGISNPTTPSTAGIGVLMLDHKNDPTTGGIITSTTPYEFEYIPTLEIQTEHSSSNDAGAVLKQILGVDFGSDLASRFVLEAGTLKKVTSPSPNISSLRKGFDVLGSDSTYGLDLGFDNIDSSDPKDLKNNSQDEFGIRPMPGITNVVINARSTTSGIGLQALRECTVSIKCHSMAQLQAIELLYMRPGYTALLEWGHSVYFNDSNEEPQQNFHHIDIFETGKDRFGIYQEIFDKKKESNGNYDAIFGKVNNFSWTADDNGGYDITVNILSMNDIIDSLKINSVIFNPTKKDMDDNEEIKKDSLLSTNPINFVFGNILLAFGASYISETHLIGEDDVTEHIGAGDHNLDFDELFKNHDSTRINGEIKAKLKKLFPIGKIKYGKLKLQSQSEEGTSPPSSNQIYINLNDFIKFINTALIPYEGTTSKNPPNKVLKVINLDEDDYCLTHPCQISTDPFTCLIEASGYGFFVNNKGEVEQVDKENTNEIHVSDLIKKYIDHDFFNPKVGDSDVNSKIINPEVLEFGLANGLKKPGFFLGTFKGNDREDFYSLFLNEKFKNAKYKFSVKSDADQKLFITTMYGTELNLRFTDYRHIFDVREKMLKELEENGDPPLRETKKSTETSKAGTPVTFFTYGSSGDNQINDTLTKHFPYRKGKKGSDRFTGQMKNILINVQYIIDTAIASEDEKTGKLVLKKFIENVFRGIERSTGQINNFAITPYEGEYTTSGSIEVPKNLETLRIIDESMMNSKFEDYLNKEYYEFPVLNYNSLVTNYKLSSTISQDIAATVSIGAQNVGTNHAPTGENSVFNAFNQGIKDRLAQPIIDQINSPEDLKKIESQKINGLNNSLFGLFLVITRIYNNSMHFSKDTSLASKTLTDYINYFNAQVPSVNKLFYSFTPFPMELSLTIDGISGIAVGSIITLPVERLPLLYRYWDPDDTPSFNKPKVAFIVKGVNHTVDDRGWFTDIPCQMIMMPRTSDETKVDEDLNSKDTDNKSSSSDKTVVDDEKPLDWDSDGGDDGEKRQGRNLPSPKSQPGSALDHNKVKYIVVHCTANGPTSKLGASDIRRFHLSLGWDDIGYHYIIKRDGTIEKGRDISRTGAHTYGYNSESVGVSYVGGIDNNNNAEDNRTPQQKQSLIKILKELKQKFPQAKIQGHRDFAGVAKACPCFDAIPEYKNI